MAKNPSQKGALPSELAETNQEDFKPWSAWNPWPLSLKNHLWHRSRWRWNLLWQWNQWCPNGGTTRCVAAGIGGLGEWPVSFLRSACFSTKSWVVSRIEKKLTKKDGKKLPKEVNVVFLPSVSYHEKAHGKTVAFPWGLLSQGPQRSWRQSYALHAFRLKDAGRCSDDQEFPWSKRGYTVYIYVGRENDSDTHWNHNIFCKYFWSFWRLVTWTCQWIVAFFSSHLRLCCSIRSWGSRAFGAATETRRGQSSLDNMVFGWWTRWCQRKCSRGNLLKWQQFSNFEHRLWRYCGPIGFSIYFWAFFWRWCWTVRSLNQMESARGNT